MLHPFVPPCGLESRFVWQVRDRQGIEVRLGLVEELVGAWPLPATPSHPNHPLPHRQEKAAVTNRLIEESIRRGHQRHNGLQMWWALCRSEPLGLADIGSAGHTDVAVAPVLRGDPLDRVVAIRAVVAIGE